MEEHERKEKAHSTEGASLLLQELFFSTAVNLIYLLGASSEKVNSGLTLTANYNSYVKHTHMSQE